MARSRPSIIRRSFACPAFAQSGVCPIPPGSLRQRLESRGLVQRQSLAGDRRVKALTITPDGMRLRKSVMELMSEPPDAIAALSEDDQRALRDILARAVEHLRVAD